MSPGWSVVCLAEYNNKSICSQVSLCLTPRLKVKVTAVISPSPSHTLSHVSLSIQIKKYAMAES